MDLPALLHDVAAGRPPVPDGSVAVVDPPDERSVGVFAFTAHHVVAAPVDAGWVSARLSDDETVSDEDLSAPVKPQFLAALAVHLGRSIGNLDMVLAAPPGGDAPDLGELTGSAHARVALAQAFRRDVRVWTVRGGLLVLGRGVAGRYEVAVEVDEGARGQGVGTALFVAARALVPPDEPVWAQVAPGNVASVRSVLAAGYRPVGAEVLLTP